jgi:hypothetical protein
MKKTKWRLPIALLACLSLLTASVLPALAVDGEGPKDVLLSEGGEEEPVLVNRTLLNVTGTWQIESTTQWGGVLQVGDPNSGSRLTGAGNPESYTWEIRTDTVYGSYAYMELFSQDFDAEFSYRNGWATNEGFLVPLEGVEYVVLTAKIENKAALLEKYFSKYVLGTGWNVAGSNDGNTALAIAFSDAVNVGGNADESMVCGAGVTQADLYKALMEAPENEWTKLVLPVTGSFEEGQAATWTHFNLNGGMNGTLQLHLKSMDLCNKDYLQSVGILPKDNDPDDGQLVFVQDPPFTLNGNNWAPQLTLEVVEEAMKPAYNTVQVEMSCSDVAALLAKYSWGSPASVDQGILDAGGGWDYGGNTALALYFTGSDVNNVGIRKDVLKSALEVAEADLQKGGFVTLELPLSGAFPEGASITGLNLIISHNDAASLEGIELNFRNFTFVSKAVEANDPDDGAVEFKPGNSYKLVSNDWDPQLALECETENASTAYNTVEIRLECTDIQTILNNFQIGSKGSTDPAAVANNQVDVNSQTALGLYFTGAPNVGVLQMDLYEKLNETAVKNALAAGEAVWIELPLAGKFEAGAAITGVSAMLTCGEARGAAIGGLLFHVVDLRLVDNSQVNDAEDGLLVFDHSNTYTLNGNPSGPQLSANSASENMKDSYNSIEVEVICTGIEELLAAYRPGSIASIGGAGTSTDETQALGLFFNGTNVSGIGVTQQDLIAALTAAKDSLKAGETVKVELALKGGAFASGAAVDCVQFMFGMGDSAAALNGINLGLKSFRFVHKDTEEPSEPVWGSNVVFSGEEGAWENQDGVQSILEPRHIVSIRAWDGVGSVNVLEESENAYLRVETGEPFNNNFWIQTTPSEYTLSDITHLQMDIRIADPADVDYLISLPVFSKGSSLGGESYGEEAYFVYFAVGEQQAGTSGVLQTALKQLLTEHQAELKAGEWVTLQLPIQNAAELAALEFESLQFKFGKEENLSGCTIDFDNICFIKAGGGEPEEPEEPTNDPNDGKLVFPNDTSFAMNGEAAWDPQLVAGVLEETMKIGYDTIEMEVSCSDITTFLNNFKAGSRSVAGGGEFSYDAARDLGLYFDGVKVDGIGVTQVDLLNALTAAKDSLAGGQTVKLELAIKGGDFSADSKITAVKIMMTNDALAAAIDGIELRISSFQFLDKKTGSNPVPGGDNPGGGDEPGGDDEPGGEVTNDPDDGKLVLQNGNSYTLTEEAWGPQLTAPIAEERMKAEYDTIKFDLKCSAIQTILDNLTAGSISSVDGGSYTYDATKDLGIFFGGTGVEGIGVTQDALRRALETVKSTLADGTSVTLQLPLAGSFSDSSTITSIQMMLTHGNSNLQGIVLELSNVELFKKGSGSSGGNEEVGSEGNWETNVIFSGEEGTWENQNGLQSDLRPRSIVSIASWGAPADVNSVNVLKQGGNTYLQMASQSEFDSNFWIETSSSEYKLDGVTYIQMDIQIPDPKHLAYLMGIPLFSKASSSGAASYGGDAYFISFTNESTSATVGILQTQLKAALAHYQSQLEAGEWVTIQLPIDDAAKMASLQFDSIQFKFGQENGDRLATVVNFDNIKFMTGTPSETYEDATTPGGNTPGGTTDPTDPSNPGGTVGGNITFASGDIRSTLKTITIDFDGRKIYVGEGTIVRDMLTYIELSEGLTGRVYYQSALMSNRSKEITGSDFEFVVTYNANDEVRFRIVVCELDENGDLIIPTGDDGETPVVTPPAATGSGFALWQLMLMIVASVAVGAGGVLLIRLIVDRSKMQKANP